MDEPDMAEPDRFPLPIAELAMDCEGFFLCFERGLELSLRLINEANVIEQVGDTLPIAEFAVDSKGLFLGFKRGFEIALRLIDNAEVAEGGCAIALIASRRIVSFRQLQGLQRTPEVGDAIKLHAQSQVKGRKLGRRNSGALGRVQEALGVGNLRVPVRKVRHFPFGNGEWRIEAVGRGAEAPEILGMARQRTQGRFVHPEEQRDPILRN